MSKLRMIAPSGNVGEVNVANLQNALNDGYQTEDSNKSFKMTSPSGNSGNVRGSNLHNAFKDGYQFADPNWLDRAKEVGQGAVSTLGGTADFVNKYVAAPVSHAAGYAADLASYSAKNMGLDKTSEGIGTIAKGAHDLGHQYTNSNTAESLPNSEFLKTESLPDENSKYYKAAGSTAASLLPFSAAGKGIQVLTKAGGVAKMPWIENLNKILAVEVTGAHAISFAASGVGGEFAKSEDPNANPAVNTVREILGAGVAGGGAAVISHAAAPAVHALWKTMRHPLEAAKGAGSTILAEATGGTINKEALEAAEKLGLHLPPSLATDSNIAKGIENTALKSWFTSKAYNEVIEKIPQSIIKEIDKNLDEIGIKIASTGSETASQIASGEYKSALQNQAEIWHQESKTLFGNAVKSLTENDVMQIPKTLETVTSMKAELSKGVRAPDSSKKAILDNLNELELKLSTDVRVSDLMAEQQDLLRLGKYGKAEGFENFYNGIAGTLTDELATYKGNKTFTENYMPARAFYKENIINKLRVDTAKNILQEQSPKEAFSFMNTPQRVKELKHILGNHENAKEIMGSLKRAKISQILVDSNIINSTGEFNSGAFTRMFGKESKEPLLKALMGDNYSKVQASILPLAAAITRSGKVLANPSGSANVIKDYGIVANTAVGVASGVATGSIPVAAGVAASGAALINIISRAFASPKYLEKLIARSTRLEKASELKKVPGNGIKEKLLKSSESILSQPYMKYNALKALSGGGLGFDSDKFLDAVKDSTDRSSFLHTPEEMKKMRKK